MNLKEIERDLAQAQGIRIDYETQISNAASARKILNIGVPALIAKVRELTWLLKHRDDYALYSATQKEYQEWQMRYMKAFADLEDTDDNHTDQ